MNSGCTYAKSFVELMLNEQQNRLIQIVGFCLILLHTNSFRSLNTELT